MLIGLDGEVAWNLPDGDLSYWRGRIEEIEHRPYRRRVGGVIMS